MSNKRANAVDNCLLTAGNQLYAAVHEQQMRGRIARFRKGVQCHFHQALAQCFVAIAHKILTDKYGIGLQLSAFARSGLSVGPFPLSTTNLNIPEIIFLLNRNRACHTTRQMLKIRDSSFVANLHQQRITATIKFLLRHHQRLGALQPACVDFLHMRFLSCKAP